MGHGARVALTAGWSLCFSRGARPVSLQWALQRASQAVSAGPEGDFRAGGLLRTRFSGACVARVWP